MGHDLKGRMSAMLETFAGVVTLTQPHDTPEGGSPRNTNCDYAVGSVFSRQGLVNPFTYSGNSVGPSPGSSAVDTSIGGSVWANPGNALLNTGVYATANLFTSVSASSATSNGSSVGGGVAWTNPTNIDSNSAFATVSLSSGGGGNVTPNQTNGSVNATATSTDQYVDKTTTLLGFNSTPATSATLYVAVASGMIVSDVGYVNLNYSIDSGVTWTTVYQWSNPFGPITVPILISGITNLSTVRVQIEVNIEWGSRGSAPVTLTAHITNWYAVIPSGSSPTAQTLSAAITGLWIPSTATITGVGISFNADYSGAAPSFQVALSVGNVTDAVTLTTSPTVYTEGGNGSLWGYSSWTPSTLSTLQVNLFASTTGTTTVNVNELQVTVYYSGAIATDALDIKQFGFSLPATVTPQGFTLAIKGYASAASTLNVQMLKAGVPVGNVESVALNVGSVTTLSLGGINDLFGGTWIYSDLNNTTFGVRLTATGNNAAEVFIGYVTLKADFLPTQENFNFIATYEDAFGNIYNVALDASGEFWIEYVSTNPGVLVPLFGGPPANSFASSFTANSRQYIAISDLLQGSYPPQQIVGTTPAQTGWNDRVSQVGPGAPPSFSGTLAASNSISITAYSYSSGILTLTATNTLTAGEVIVINALSTDPLYALNGKLFNVLGTGLGPTAFEIAETTVTGSGSTTAQAASQYTYPVVASPNGITQFPFWNSAQGYQSQLDDILWSAGPGSTSSGNVVTVYYLNAYTHQTGVDANLAKAIQQALFPVYVYVSGTNMPVANGTQLVTGTGIGTPPGGGDQRYYFTFNVASSSYSNIGGGSNAQPGQYRLTVATLTTSLPLPGVQTGDAVTISGDPVPAWDNTWPIVNALNSGSYSISQTSMAAGIATYSWALSGATSTPPAAGQLVTVTGTLNGNGIFNVTDAEIATVTGTSSGTFTVAGFGAQTFSTQAEVAQATTSGTKFQIDPGALTLGNAADNPIYGNSGGGYITLVGSSSVVVGTGTRKGTVFFITRNGFWTCPAPPVQFNTNENTNYILVSNIPIGPPNVIARGIAFTEAGQEGQPGASYYTIPTPVQFVYNGITYLSSSLIINDNETTSAKFTFPDNVLLNAEEIDIQGNNLFALGELGDAAWCAQYAGRPVYGRVRNKIQNFLNLSFDGGYNPNPGGNLLPLGWGLDPASSPSNSPPDLLISPVFGNSYYILNATGETQAVLGMITQSAYQDWHYVAILQNQTPYSVRVTCRTPSSAIAGSLVIDLTSYNAGSGYGQTYGSFTLALSAMTSNMATYTGTLLTSTTLNIPPDVLLRVWASGLAANADIEIDRIEIYPTLAPTNLTALQIGYKDDFDSFDQVTGNADTTTVNAQPANGAFEMNDLLYVVKESSLGYLANTPNQEPQSWNPFKEVSNVAGACGINAFDVGKKWAAMACQNGFFLFNGGEPIPIQLEYPDIWQAINWPYAQSLCLRNDTANNRFVIACPMATPNQWCPEFEENDGTGGNNVTLFVNYDGIGTIEELMNASPLHVTLMGKLAVHDMRRKCSLWSIPSPYMAICKRSELFSELMFCNGIQSSKIYTLGSYTAGADDGVPFRSSYCTYGFVDQAKAKENPVFGMHNKRYVYYDLLISGNGSINGGTLSIEFFQNVLNAPYPFTVPGGVTLSDPATNDIEGPLDELGQRMFVEISTYGEGCYFNLSRITLVAQADAWSPIRGK